MANMTRAAVIGRGRLGQAVAEQLRIRGAEVIFLSRVNGFDIPWRYRQQQGAPSETGPSCRAQKQRSSVPATRTGCDRNTNDPRDVSPQRNRGRALLAATKVAVAGTRRAYGPEGPQ